MGVHERFRSETSFDTLDLARDLRRQITAYVLREDRIPKRWRSYYPDPLVKDAEDVRKYIKIANSIYADKPERLELRYKYQTLAIALCEEIQENLIDLEEMEQFPGVTCDNLKEITKTLDALYNKLTNWRKTDRVIT